MATKTDLNKLKKIVGATNYQYTKLVDDVYKRVIASVALPYGKEMDKLNNAITLRSESTILASNFTSYVNLLSDASKDLTGVNCSIKSNLNSFLISNIFLGYLLAKGCLLRFKTS